MAKLPKSQDFNDAKEEKSKLNLSKMSSVSSALQTKEEKLFPLDIRDLK
jgi:hypothetical protein